MLTPDMLTPDMLTPDMLTPDMLTPDMLTPDAQRIYRLFLDAITPNCPARQQGRVLDLLF